MHDHSFVLLLEEINRHLLDIEQLTLAARLDPSLRELPRILEQRQAVLGSIAGTVAQLNAIDPQWHCTLESDARYGALSAERKGLVRRIAEADAEINSMILQCKTAISNELSTLSITSHAARRYTSYSKAS